MMAYFSGIGVHKDGFQVAHEQRVHVQLLARAVHGNEIEMEIEFGEVEDFHRRAQPARWAAGARPASCQIRSWRCGGSVRQFAILPSARHILVSRLSIAGRTLHVESSPWTGNAQRSTFNVTIW